MSKLVARRARILRLRAIEHRVATAKQAHADAALANLEQIAGRLSDLRTSLAAEAGETSGLVLKSMTEMSTRLDHARASLTQPISEAEHRQALVKVERLAARQKEESAAKLHDRATDSENRAADLRASANRPFRKPAPLMKEEK